MSRQYVGRKASLIERIRNGTIEVLEDNEAILVFEGKLAKSDLPCSFLWRSKTHNIYILTNIKSNYAI